MNSSGVNGVDPSEVLKQVLERVAQSPNVAQDLSQDRHFKEVLRALRIHQILAMDRIQRRYRSDQDEGFSRQKYDELEDEEAPDEWIDDDDVGFLTKTYTKTEFEAFEKEQEELDQREQEEQVQDDDSMKDQEEGEIENLEEQDTQDEQKEIGMRVKSHKQQEQQHSCSSSVSPTFSNLCPPSSSPEEVGGIYGSGPNQALWPRQPNEFAFTQEDDRDSDEAYDESDRLSLPILDQGEDHEGEDEKDIDEDREEDEEVFQVDDVEEVDDANRGESIDTSSYQFHNPDSDNHSHSRLSIEAMRLEFQSNTYCQDNSLTKERLDRSKLETLQLRVIRQKRHTGFEPSKEFNDELGTMIGARYRIIKPIGEAAFSTTYECHDEILHVKVCLKVIKNDKDFFDQGLDEIQVLKYLNAGNEVDRYHILRLIDYFYFKEHLIIVTELLQSNLYEFSKAMMHKYNHGIDLDQIKIIMRESLEALSYIHSLQLIHCDLKPENIVCQNINPLSIKIIDFGSSCFITDYLSSYIQSRSYRAPEVILGLPYDCKIDLWSLGCIAYELFTGSVLFSNDSIPSLLARIIGIIDDIPERMLEDGKDVWKYFTARGIVYSTEPPSEDGGEDRMILFYPKQTSLWHRLRTAPSEFIDFISTLLQLDPNERPTAQQAQEHPWLQF